jgi:primosomal protein N' (replication factor Y) (superfamily II helicase)
MTQDAGTPDRPRVVRVRTEVAAVAKTFDYSVPTGWSDEVRVGTRVRAPFHGRTVRGWVVEEDVGAPAGVAVLPLKSWLGWGPPPALVALGDWAAWRWAGPASFFLRIGSPATVVRALPTPPPWREPPPPPPAAPPSRGATALAPLQLELAQPGVTIVRQPPVTDPIDLVLSVVGSPVVRGRDGSVLVLVPSSGWAERLTARLARRGCLTAASWEQARAGWPVVVGSRAGAWAPVVRLAAVVVLDAHDAAYREESAPTYSAVDVVIERARREGAPCVLATPVPPVALAERTGLRTIAPTRAEERAGWPVLERVDRRGSDPRSGMFSDEFVRLARSVLVDDATVERGPLVCVYNRTGGARVLACRHCGELARCARCGAAAAQPRGEQVLECPRCGDSRPVVCASCGRLRMKTLRAGVSRLRDELEALLGVEVGEVAGPASAGSEPPVPTAPVLVGTEAVLHRVRRAAAVVFLDIDLHLLAPRLSATEETMALFVRAARLVGTRSTGSPWARLQVQTRVPDHPLLAAIARGEPAEVLAEEVAIRRASALPPFAALALVSGVLAPTYAESLRREADAPTDPTGPTGSTVPTDPTGPAPTTTSVSPLGDDRFLLRADTHESLCDLLARTPRPPGRGLRVEVDPLSL